MSVKSRDIVNEIMTNKNITQAALGGRLGISKRAVWDRLKGNRNKEMNVSTLVEMLRVLDYKLVIVPRNKKLSEEDYEIKL